MNSYNELEETKALDYRIDKLNSQNYEINFLNYLVGDCSIFFNQFCKVV